MFKSNFLRCSSYTCRFKTKGSSNPFVSFQRTVLILKEIYSPLYNKKVFVSFDYAPSLKRFWQQLKSSYPCQKVDILYPFVVLVNIFGLCSLCIILLASSTMTDLEYFCPYLSNKRDYQKFTDLLSKRLW